MFKTINLLSKLDYRYPPLNAGVNGWMIAVSLSLIGLNIISDLCIHGTLKRQAMVGGTFLRIHALFIMHN